MYMFTAATAFYEVYQYECPVWALFSIAALDPDMGIVRNSCYLDMGLASFFHYHHHHHFRFFGSLSRT